MFIVSLSAGNIAGSVWANATRSLLTDPATDAGAATLVWTHAARQATVDPASYTLIQARSSLAAGAILDVRPAAGKFRRVTIAANLPAQVTMLFGMYDGTNFDQGAAAAQYVQINGYANATRGVSVKNSDGAATATYAYAGLESQ